MWRGGLGENICKIPRVLLSMLSATQLIAYSGFQYLRPYCYAYSNHNYSSSHFALVGSHPTQILFHPAQQKMTAQYHRATDAMSSGKPMAAIELFVFQLYSKAI